MKLQNITVLLFILSLSSCSSCSKEVDCKSYDSNNALHSVTVNPKLDVLITFTNDSFSNNISLNLIKSEKSDAYEETCTVLSSSCGCERNLEIIISNAKKTIEISNSINILEFSDKNKNPTGYQYRLKSTLSSGEKMLTPVGNEIEGTLNELLHPISINGKTYENSFIFRNRAQEYRDSTDILDSLCIQKGKGMIALWIGKDVWVREDLVE
jgi:hypothetical protein